MRNSLTSTQEFTQEDRDNLETLKGRISNFPRDRGRLIPLLQLAQEAMGYLPRQALALVADHLSIPLSQVFGVASFYNQFRFTPPGRHQIKVCMGTACHVKGGGIILENFERKLEIHEGQTTRDREFSIERVACVGCCALAPVALTGDEIHGHMAPSKVEGLVMQMKMNKPGSAENDDDE